LPGAEQFEPGQVDRLAIVGRIDDVVGSRAHLRDRAGRPGLELAVFENREVDAAEHQPREIDADPLLDRRGIDRVGEVPGLLPLDHVHVAGREEVAAVGAVFAKSLLAAGPPQVWVADVVVVGDRHGGPVADHVAKLQTEFDPRIRVLLVAIRLVAGEEEQVGVGCPQAGHDLLPRPWRFGRVAREHGHGDRLLVGGIAADDAFEDRRVAMPHAVGVVAGGVPVVDAEVGIPAGIVHCRPRDLFPGPTPPDLEPHLPRLTRLEREELRGELERGVGGVARPTVHR
jgi:hypothetical protein